MGNFFLGLGIGLIGGVLFAPKAGTETREYIRQKADEGTGYVKDRASDLSNTASDMLDKGKDMVDKGKQVFQGQKENMKERGQEAMQRS
jgi:gas vesicle protein